MDKLTHTLQNTVLNLIWSLSTVWIDWLLNNCTASDPRASWAITGDGHTSNDNKNANNNQDNNKLLVLSTEIIYWNFKASFIL